MPKPPFQVVEAENQLPPSISYYKTRTESPKSLSDLSQKISRDLILHEQSKVFKSGQLRQPIPTNWMLFVLLIALAIFAYVRSNYPKRFALLVKTILHWKVAKQIIRFEKVYSHPVNLSLNLIFLITFSLFLSLSYLIINHSTLSPFNIFSYTFVLITGYLVAKFLLFKFSKWLFEVNEAIEDYLFQVNLFNKYFGVVLIFLNTLILYSSIDPLLLIKFGFSIWVVFYAIQLIRGFSIGFHHNKKWYFIILYLCSLEILPVLILLKWVKFSFFE